MKTTILVVASLLLAAPSWAAKPKAKATAKPAAPAAAAPAPAPEPAPAPVPASVEPADPAPKIIEATAVAEPAPTVAAEPAPAPPAEQVAAPAEGPRRLGLLVEPRVGGAFPGVLNRLGASPAGILQVGFLFALQQRLGAVIELGYSQPSHERTVEDPRVPEGSYRYTVTTRDLGLFLGPKYLIPEPIPGLTPFAELGLRLHFLDTRVVGSAGGQEFGENGETSTQVGGALRGGAAYKLGPGSLSLAVELAYAKVGQLVTGETNIGNLGTYLGYMLVF